MRNYCGDCLDILCEAIEWRYGYCCECLAIRFEKNEDKQYDLLFYEDEE